MMTRTVCKTPILNNRHAGIREVDIRFVNVDLQLKVVERIRADVLTRLETQEG